MERPSGVGVAARAMSPPPGIDAAASVRRAIERGSLLVTAPWVLFFYRFLPWDAEAACARCHPVSYTHLTLPTIYSV